jgi:hypothetical protein
LPKLPSIASYRVPTWAKFLVAAMSDPNPIQIVLRRQMGVDAFALDGDSTDVPDSWQDQPRRKPRAKVEIPA